MSKMSNIEMFKALSVESRYAIIEVLLKRERCACEIPELIKRTQSNTSMHLAKLADAGLIKSRREGKMIIYSIADLKARKHLERIMGKSQGKR